MNDRRASTLQFLDVVSYTDRPRRAKRAARTPTVPSGYQRAFLAGEHESILPLMSNRRTLRTIGASRRSVLKGLLTVASGAAASAAASIGSGRAVAAQDRITADGASPYRITSGCGSSFEDTNCRPGCQGAKVCNHLGCCSPQGWFRNEPSAGFMPLGFESDSCITVYADGSGGILADGWLWEYRPDLQGVDANGPCSHCTVMVTRCHDGRYFDTDMGIWQPGICRAEVSCEPSGLPRMPDLDDDVAIVAAEQEPFTPVAALDSILDVGGGEIVLTGWAHDGGPEPLEVVVSVDDQPSATVTANLTRRDVSQRDGVGCCHGFVAGIQGVSAGEHNVCVFARRKFQQVLIGCTKVVVAAYDPDAAVAEPSAVVPSPATTVPSDRLATGGIEVLMAGPYGGAYASGWAFDPDTTAPVAVVATVEGREAASTIANLARSDVSYLAPHRAPSSGWTLVIPYPPIDPENPPDRINDARTMTHEVCVYVVDATDGRRRLLGCKSVASTETWNVEKYPTSGISTDAASMTPGEAEQKPLVATTAQIQGAVEVVDSPAQGMIVVSGWCRSSDGAVDVEIVVDNTSRKTVQANEPRQDLAEVFGDDDGDHGFRAAVSGVTGSVVVEAFALDTNGERVGLLGLSRVFVG